MPDAGAAREIDRPGELRDERQHLLDRRGRVVPHGHVERLGRDVLVGAIRGGPFHAGAHRLDDRRMEQSGFRRFRQLVSERLCLLRCDVETKELDGHEPVAGWLVGAEDGTKRADTDLMQHPEGAECGGRCERRRIVSGQLSELLEAGFTICSTLSLFNFPESTPARPASNHWSLPWHVSEGSERVRRRVTRWRRGLL